MMSNLSKLYSLQRLTKTGTAVDYSSCTGSQPGLVLPTCVLDMAYPRSEFQVALGPSNESATLPFFSNNTATSKQRDWGEDSAGKSRLFLNASITQPDDLM